MQKAHAPELLTNYNRVDSEERNQSEGMALLIECLYIYNDTSLDVNEVKFKPRNIHAHCACSRHFYVRF